MLATCMVCFTTLLFFKLSMSLHLNYTSYKQHKVGSCLFLPLLPQLDNLCLLIESIGAVVFTILCCVFYFSSTFSSVHLLPSFMLVEVFSISFDFLCWIFGCAFLYYFLVVALRFIVYTSNRS